MTKQTWAERFDEEFLNRLIAFGNYHIDKGGRVATNNTSVIFLLNDVKSFISAEKKLSKEEGENEADWWGEELMTARLSLLDELDKRVEGMKRTEYSGFSSDIVFNRGFNKGLSMVQQIINEMRKK